MSAKGIYKFHWDCGRQGSLSGVFIATADDVASIHGKHIYFGEVLGKHSEISGVIKHGDITLASDDPSAVEVVESLKLSTGFNPFEFLEEDDGEGGDE